MMNLQKSFHYVLRLCSAVALSVSFHGIAGAKAELTGVAMADVVGPRVAAHDHADHSEPNADEVRYTCPMHPEVVSETPGRCPHCGMKLVEQPRPKMTEGP
jgi:DNA-directed RNA polymerase subunit RPC12/RpoP